MKTDQEPLSLSLVNTIFDVIIEKAHYENKRIALRAVDAYNGEPVATITVNMPHLTCPPGYTWIKNHSENEGIMEQLVEAGVLESPVADNPSGFVTVYLCKVMI